MDLIRYATETDGPGLAKVNVQSFQGRRLLEELFPEASLTRMQEYKIVVGMKHLANPNMHVLKIHDPVSGELATYSRWQFPTSFGPSLVTLSEKAAWLAKDPIPHAPKPMNEEVFNAFKKLLEDGRKRYTTENDISKWPPHPFIPSKGILLKWIISPRSTSNPTGISRARFWLCCLEMGHEQGRCLPVTHLPRGYARRCPHLSQTRMEDTRGGGYGLYTIW